MKPIPYTPTQNSPSLGVPTEMLKHIVFILAGNTSEDTLYKLLSKLPIDPGSLYIVLAWDTDSPPSNISRERQSPEWVWVEVPMDLSLGKVYIFPSHKEWGLDVEKLRVQPLAKVQGPYVARFFRALGHVHRLPIFLLVLSQVQDGVLSSIKTIKALGGMIMASRVNSDVWVQELAPFSDVLIDYLVSIEEIPALLEAHLNNESLEDKLQGHLSAQELLIRIFRIIKSVTKADFSFYNRTLIIAKLQRRMNYYGLSSLKAYAELLERRSSEVELLKKELLVSFSRFFRDQEAFDYLRDEVIPQLFLHAHKDQLRIWVVGCATGEEVYSLAILLYEYAAKSDKDYNIKIFASDIDQDALSFAGMGRYSELALQEVPPAFKQRYFKVYGDQFEIMPFIRSMVIFTPHDIIADPPFHRLDFISCRYLLYNFSPALQTKVLNIFDYSLQNGGLLWLGTHEHPEAIQERFQVFNDTWKVFKCVTKQTLIFSANQRKFIEGFESGLAPGIGNIEERKTKAWKGALLDSALAYVAAEVDRVCLIMSTDFELIRHFGEVDTYLSVPSDPGRWNVLSMVHEDLRVSIQMAGNRAMESKERVSYSHIQIRAGIHNEAQTLNLSMIPVKLPHGSEYFLVALLRKAEHQAEGMGASLSASALQQERIKDLEQTLTQLQEEFEREKDDWQISHELLQSTNEELQSINEELQFVNEELYTINTQNQSQLSKLYDIHDSVDNMLHHTQVGVLFLNHKLEIVKFNRKILHAINITDADLGRSIGHFSLNVEIEGFKEKLETILREKKSYRIQVKDTNGSTFLLFMAPYRVRASGKVGVSITLVYLGKLKEGLLYEEYKVLKQALSEKEVLLLEGTNYQQLLEQSLTTLVDAHPKAIIWLDKQGVCQRVWAHEQAETAIFAFKPAVVGKAWIIQFAPERRQQLLSMINQAVEQQEATVKQFRGTQNATVRASEVRVIPLAEGRSLICWEDLSQVEELTELQNEHLSMLHLFTNQFSEVEIYAFDLSHRCLFSNAPSLDPPINGKPMDACFDLAMRERLGGYWEKAYSGFNSEVNEQIANERYQTSFFPLRSVRRGIYGAGMVRKKVTTLEKMRSDLEEKIFELERFAYAVSHDLKEPVRSLVSFSQLLKRKLMKALKSEEAPDPQVLDYLEFIISGSIRMKQLIDGLLSYSRIDAVDDVVEEVEVSEILSKCLNNLHTTLEENKVEVKIGELPRVKVRAIWLLQVLQNLIENGIKFNDKEKKMIQISAQRKDDSWVVSVLDNGIGVKKVYWDQIFIIFKHLNSRKQYHGSGIGLAICKKIVESWKGRLWLESEPGVGSTFLFSIPD